jgi:trehalose 6-phosphate phosphatase
VDEATHAAVAGLVADELGARLEDKRAALVVHVRETSDPAAAAARLRAPLARLAAAAGLDLLEGKMVLELAPAGAGKGAAVRALAEGAAAVLVAGDDAADLDAFAAARELAGSGLAVGLVAVGGPETPAEVVAAADEVVDGPEGLLDLLASM